VPEDKINPHKSGDPTLPQKDPIERPYTQLNAVFKTSANDALPSTSSWSLPRDWQAAASHQRVKRQ